MNIMTIIKKKTILIRVRKRGNFVGCNISKATVVETPYKGGDNKPLLKVQKRRRPKKKLKPSRFTPEKISLRKL